jgi:HAD superfamily hydrolase (TIGR01450 family)
VSTDFDAFDAVLLDLDGTVYHEEQALPGAIDLIRRLLRGGRPFACLTNSTSSPSRIAARLGRMGVELPKDMIYTAAAAAADYVVSQWGLGAARVYNLATEGIHELLDGRVQWVATPRDEPCGVVLAGNVTSVYATEERQRAALEILRRRGRHNDTANPPPRLIGICADRVYPSPRGIEFGSGALTHMLAYAADVTPTFCGKPEPVFFQELCRRLGASPQRCLLIGDNLESDIAGGRRLGMHTILTLTGVTRREDLTDLPAGERPDRVIVDLTEMVGRD